MYVCISSNSEHTTPSASGFALILASRVGSLSGHSYTHVVVANLLCSLHVNKKYLYTDSGMVVLCVKKETIVNYRELPATSCFLPSSISN